MPSSRLIVGLGNPGPKYENTRHNVGFRVVDALADRLHISSFSREHDALVGWGQYKNRKIGLAKPLTLMNRSGQAVAPLCDYNNLDPSDLIVVVDDLTEEEKAELSDEELAELEAKAEEAEEEEGEGEEGEEPPAEA